MTDSKKMFREDLILFNMEAKDNKDAIEQLANKLLSKGIVKESFVEAIKAREDNYPTGLPTETIGVAIPHTDAIHVNEGALAIGLLKEPVAFQMMGMPEETVNVSVIFMMALNEAHGHLEMLQKLMGIFQEKELLIKINEAKTPEEIAEVLSDVI
ncbi:PTS sugar transporter subunit IIA [Tissierella sp. MSJ-40]|jgi:PTS system galactitol-specific IIA component|uniref:PTS sugar transporter subunit IIA n=1 Tax=Tissierella simiarum TaxID=2841534 RepID=A0ABS6E8M0_9FIRM|nr:PTS sugar transporter subunit IIA [Tissierella simiarum]MBU5439099.1 PTS sugar transporter subunit IIA [Tissierella simiarum]